MKHPKINTALLKRYAAGSCNAEEKAAVENWLATGNLSEEEQGDSTLAEPAATRANIWRKISPPTIKRQRSYKWLNWAALFLCFIAGIIWYTQKPAGQTISIPSGKRHSLTLADGSIVQLNSNSEIRYTEPFHERTVYLSGEASFQVSSQPNRPFVVETAQGKITVLGTTFNISSYPEERSHVAVLNGKVRYEDKLSPFKAVLTANEAILFDSLNHPHKETLQASDHLLWTQQVLYFNHDPLATAIKKIERWFGVRIHVKDNRLQQETFKGRFDHPTLDQVLQSICFGLNLQYTQTAQDIYISKQ